MREISQVSREFVETYAPHPAHCSKVRSASRNSTAQPTHLPLLMINHDIMRLDIPMHDPPRVAEIERLEQLVDVVPDVVVGQARVEDFEVGVVDVLEDQGGGLALRRA